MDQEPGEGWGEEWVVSRRGLRVLHAQEEEEEGSGEERGEEEFILGGFQILRIFLRR